MTPFYIRINISICSIILTVHIDSKMLHEFVILYISINQV